MQQKPLTVTVGIPAYNEEANIAQIVTQLLTQNESNYVLREIIIVSDASTDRTVTQARSIRDDRVTVVPKSVREGVAIRQNDILRMSESEVVIILDADVYIPDAGFLSCLVQPFYERTNLGIVAAKVVPLEAANFIEKVVNASVHLKTEIYEQINAQNNIYLCHGRARAFSKQFASRLEFPKEAGEDAYSYIECLRQGYEFYYEPEAKVCYRSPQTLRDHLKQSKRFFISRDLWDVRNRGQTKSYYHIPRGLLLKTLLTHLVRHPVLLSAYLIIYCWARLASMWYETGSVWDVSMSSKSVVKRIE